MKRKIVVIGYNRLDLVHISFNIYFIRKVDYNIEDAKLRAIKIVILKGLQTTSRC